MRYASGVTLGLAVSVGGIVAPALGAIADATSLVAAIWIIGAIALVPLAGALLLPRDERVR